MGIDASGWSPGPVASLRSISTPDSSPTCERSFNVPKQPRRREVLTGRMRHDSSDSHRRRGQLFWSIVVGSLSSAAFTALGLQQVVIGNAGGYLFVGIAMLAFAVLAFAGYVGKSESPKKDRISVDLAVRIGLVIFALVVLVSYAIYSWVAS